MKNTFQISRKFSCKQVIEYGDKSSNIKNNKNMKNIINYTKNYIKF